MKIVVTHSSPDMDAITSVWLIRKFLPNWSDALVRFVPAGERFTFRKTQNAQSSSVSDGQTIRQSDSPSSSEFSEVVENIGEDEVIHVDTGLGPLDHHQTASDEVCGASLTFDFVKRVQNSKFSPRGEAGKIQNLESKKWNDRMKAVGRMVKVVVDIDHFKEVFRKDPLADYHEFDLAGILDGLKLELPGQDELYVAEVSKSLDAILHGFENRIWAEKEIREKGKKFKTRFGRGIGLETINDSVVKLAQKMGYVIAVRKDPRKGYVRIKVRPDSKIDLTLVYEKFRKIDPDATWFLHVSKKMLLNGSVKNPKMRSTKLSLNDIIRVLEKI
ncbi:MAG: hypothetical protein HYW62_00525 [Candidatus Levybacteria bacterium]|nr:hypothetical protein [Candidatus Levybacteria bacterium]